MDYERLLAELEQRLAEAPQDAMLMNKLAVAYMENNRYDEAFELFKGAVELNPCIETLTNLGWFYLHEGKPSADGYYEAAEEEAIELLERAVKYNPGLYLPYSALGEAYLRTNRFGKAEAVLRRAAAINGSGFNLNNLGAALYKQGKIAEALEWFRKAYETMKGQNDNFRAGINYGITLALSGKSREAEEVAAFLTGSRPNNEWYFDPADIAQIYYMTGNYAEAINLFGSCGCLLGIGLVELHAYALIKCGERELAFKLMEELLADNHERIIEAENDDELDEPEAKELVRHLAAENIRLNGLLEKLKQGIKPELEFEPYTTDGCYLYGCYRHNNPDTEGISP